MKLIAAARRAASSGSRRSSSSCSSSGSSTTSTGSSDIETESSYGATYPWRWSLLGIHVDRERDSAVLLRLGDGLDRVPDGAHRGHPLGPAGRRFHEQLSAVAALQPEQRGGAQEARLRGLEVDALAERGGRSCLGARFVRRADDSHQLSVRRIPEQLSPLELVGADPPGVVRRAEAPGTRAGVERLHDHAPAARAAAAAAGELSYQGEGALLGTEVWEAERGVGVEDDPERDVREVVPLGDHLRPYEHAARRLLEATQEVEDGAPAAGDVRVEAEHRQRRQRAVELRLEPLGACTV